MSFDLKADWRRVLVEQMLLRAHQMARVPWCHWPLVGNTQPYGANDWRGYR